jgi:hypothetical protein
MLATKEGSRVMTTKNELRAEIVIEADPDTVWGVLTDFEAYPDWNPFLRSIVGGRTVGSRLHVRLQPPEGRGITMNPAVTVNEPGRAFGWLGKLGGVSHLFDGAHRFELEPLDGGRRTRFVQSERFQGILLPLVRRSVLPPTLRGFEAMNRALADRAVARKAAAA